MPSPKAGSDDRGGLKDATLAVFFTYGVSLRTWAEKGLLSREMALYIKLARRLKRIYILTYGGPDDASFAGDLPGNITILPMRYLSSRSKLAVMAHSLLAGAVYRRELAGADILKTKQMLGAWCALAAKPMGRGRLYVRTGYTWSRIVERETTNPLKRALARAAELVVYAFSDAAVVAAEDDMQYVRERHRLRGPAECIPNFVDTELFMPSCGPRRKGSLVFVGRLNAIKNLESLIQALAGSKYSLTLVGTGEMEGSLRELADRLGVSVRFAGAIANDRLPNVYNAHEAFVLVSHYDGMPKTLIEAMACGLPVIGTKVPNIRDMIDDGKTGVLCGTDSASIRAAVDRVMGDAPLRERLGREARKTAVSLYSLDAVVERELALYRTVLGRSVKKTLTS